jgi:hypothetical protein
MEVASDFAASRDKEIKYALLCGIVFAKRDKATVSIDFTFNKDGSPKITVFP